MDTEQSRQGTPLEPSLGGSPSKCPKSYVTILHDVLSQERKLTPVYQLVSMEGMSHEPTFVYKVHVDGTEAQGRGRRKQEARQLAAKNLLIKLNRLPPAEVDAMEGEGETLVEEKVEEVGRGVHNIQLAAKFPLVDTSSVVDGSTATVTVHTAAAPAATEPVAAAPEVASPSAPPPGSAPGARRFPAQPGQQYPVPHCRKENPVGSLQELTLSIRWPPPQFELHEREGAAHDATFSICCYVWSYKALGRGKSKKEAKRMAAANMYEILRTAPDVLELWQKRAEAYAARAYSNRNNRHRQPIPQRAPPMQTLYKDLMANQTCDSLAALRSLSLNEVLNHPDPLDVIRELATQLHFDILFDDLFDFTRVKDEKISLPTFPQPVAAASLITLTLPRQVVCFGTGATKSASRRAAAIDALCYLYTAAAQTLTLEKSP
ncbi:RISC-loading complex subunit TARBP2-like [Paramacrobiotus metropolitanus]|uniref:RISC-loading complex subunit TARBP2-like n=1 Tax=Paramacrobiotus metropolitanus TaxID=2943436 RepID=UPI0024458722|nr:RISC-loading complex subunit TARBP2-like [Paramacrobiotus metropolitanus]